ncbi:MAG: hypothetical protein NC124_20000 [Clostridium sp.]|nr:hypothetical protein [Clostridium sp.]
MEIKDRIIMRRVEEMYRKYGVDLAFLERLNDEQKIKGMKGILAELDLKKNGDYTSDDLLFIRKIYSMLC